MTSPPSRLGRLNGSKPPSDHLPKLEDGLGSIVQVPTEIPVMVLSRAILFPQSILPLHIFESRYRRMLKDSLATHRMFGIGTVRPSPDGWEENEEEVYNVFGIGIVRVAVNQPDGTSSLILQGLCRARAVNLVEGKPYRRAHIEILQDQGKDCVAMDALSAKVAELVKIRAGLGTLYPKDAIEYLASLRYPGVLSDLVTSTLLEDPQEKQDILETLDLLERLKKVIHFLQKDIQRLLLAKDMGNKLDDNSAALN